jgi:hypothetical protein
MFRIMTMGLLYRLILWSSVCVGGLGSSGFCDRHSHCQMVGQYRTDIISNMGHPRSESVGLLVVDGRLQ